MKREVARPRARSERGECGGVRGEFCGGGIEGVEEDAVEAEAMEAHETALMRQLGFADPYLDA